MEVSKGWKATDIRGFAAAGDWNVKQEKLTSVGSCCVNLSPKVRASDQTNFGMG